jgi:hypothetical protein
MAMDGLVGPLFIAALLLVVAGAPKVLDPGDTTRAIRSVGLPARDGLVRILALGEVTVGTTVVAVGGTVPAALLGTLYAGFAVFIVMAIARGGAVASCGCFGTPDTPPTYAHLVLNVGAAAVGFAAALSGPPGVLDVLPTQPAAGIPFLGFVALGGWFGYLALTLLPRLETAKTAS